MTLLPEKRCQVKKGSSVRISERIGEMVYFYRLEEGRTITYADEKKVYTLSDRGIENKLDNCSVFKSILIVYSYRKYFIHK